MLNHLWSFLIIFSIMCSFFTNRVEATASAILTGCKMSTDFLISIAGVMAFWTGIIKILQKSKFDTLVSRLLRPFVKILFPELNPEENGSLINSICVTSTANFLGLSNVVTPFAIDTISKIEKLDISQKQKNDTINMFILLSVASIQPIPNMLISLRKQYNSSSPFSVLPAIWITSLLSLTFGILVLKLLNVFSFTNSKKIQKNKTPVSGNIVANVKKQ